MTRRRLLGAALVLHPRVRAAGVEVPLDPNAVRTMVPPHQETLVALHGRGLELLEPRGRAGLRSAPTWPMPAGPWGLQVAASYWQH